MPETEQGIDDIARLSPREKYRQLSPLFHPDHGGDHELMVALNRAYEEARNGNSQRLDAIFKEWCTSEGQNIKKLQAELEAESNALFERNKRDRYARNGGIYLRVKYQDLCRKYGLPQDEKFLAMFLYDQGWITEEERDRLLSGKRIYN